MNDLIRKATAVWKGDLRDGNGIISTDSHALNEKAYSYRTRFENEPGTNPEELIAAAHAACYCMAFAGKLKQNGYQPAKLEANTSCYLEPKKEGGFAITKMRLHVRGDVPGIDSVTLEKLSQEADKACPVSNLLRCGLRIELEVELIESSTTDK